MTDWQPITTLTQLVEHFLAYGLEPDDAWKKAQGTPLGRVATAADYQKAKALIATTHASWNEIVTAYRSVGEPRPTQVRVAGAMKIAEDTLRVRLRTLHGIQSWHDIHARIA